MPRAWRRYAAENSSGRAAFMKSKMHFAPEKFFAPFGVLRPEPKFLSVVKSNSGWKTGLFHLARKLRTSLRRRRRSRLCASCLEKETAVMTYLTHESFELSPEYEALEAGPFEMGGETEWGHEFQEALSEQELMELTHELLEVSSEQELDMFLGDLIKRVGGFIRSPAGQAIGGVLKGVAKKLIPVAGAALGGFVGGPIGAKIGGGLANLAGNALGLEYEMMSAEDREFEGAKQFVKLASAAVKSAASAPQTANPIAQAQAAVAAAAQRHAPGLLEGMGVVQAGAPVGSCARGGRWIRRGRNIILVNAI
jgi:hypothetical protein